MSRYLWFKDITIRDSRITKMLFKDSKQPDNINLKTGERIVEGAPYYRTRMEKLPIDDVEHNFYYRDKSFGGYVIWVQIDGAWYRGKGFLFADKLFTTKNKVED